jgi:hypothetical protein
VDGHVDDVQVGDYIKFAVDTLKSGAQVIKSITEVARAWGRYHQEKAEAEARAAAAAAEAEAEAAAAAAQQEADEEEARAQNRRINQEDEEAREAELHAERQALVDAEAAVAAEAADARAAAPQDAEDAPPQDAPAAAAAPPQEAAVAPLRTVIDPQEALDRDLFIDKYGQEMYDAMAAYSTNEGYSWMNEYLRGIISEDQLNAYDPSYLSYIDRAKAFFENKTIAQETTVYRYFGMFQDYASDVISSTGQLLDTAQYLLLDRIITDKGFTSTATRDDPTSSFASIGNTKLILKMPAGSPAGIGLDGISEYPGEYEYLLPPGSRYKINRVVRNRATGKLEIYATLLK